MHKQPLVNFVNIDRGTLLVVIASGVSGGTAPGDTLQGVTPKRKKIVAEFTKITSARRPIMQILVSIGAVGASPQIGDMLPLVTFFTVLSLFSRERAQVEPLNRFSRFMAQTTCFRVRKCLLGVRTVGDNIWGNMPPKPQKWA